MCVYVYAYDMHLNIVYIYRIYIYICAYHLPLNVISWKLGTEDGTTRLSRGGLVIPSPGEVGPYTNTISGQVDGGTVTGAHTETKP